LLDAELGEMASLPPSADAHSSRLGSLNFNELASGGAEGHPQWKMRRRGGKAGCRSLNSLSYSIAKNNRFKLLIRR
jgi:hypothetical protein